MPGIWQIRAREGTGRPYDFKPYRLGQTLAPVTKVTPDDGFYLHSFYDVCPWSPSQRYLTVTRLPYQGLKPRWGDKAGVCVIDLYEQTIETVYETKAWSFQVGANVQWGNMGDRYLYANDIIDEIPVCVRIDLETKEITAYAGPKYDLSPDERYVISPNLLNMNIHQYGYSVPDPLGKKPMPFTPDDMEYEGLWRTDLQRNRKELLVPMNYFVRASSEQDFYRKGVGYLFHSKYNLQNTRIMQVFRCQINGAGRHASLFTMDIDGSDLSECLSREKWNQKARLGGSGNHPNWHPDGEHIVMNCIPNWLGYEDMLFCQFRFDGTDFTILSEKHLGSGHPTVEPTSRFLVSDAYIKQQYVVKGGEVPIRFIDLKEDKEYTLCTIANDVGGGGEMYTKQDREEGGSPHKLDPHPAWSRDYKKLCINGAPEGDRQVFIIDLKEWTG
ncbi:hypothetical protein [Negadavirga shengliensis]|uniref:Uncharacterized protein n=1 Tax=Negadavirga shengliensis TaxID=1389218 RepID=A0ABV9SWX4_9BACT